MSSTTVSNQSFSTTMTTITWLQWRWRNVRSSLTSCWLSEVRQKPVLSRWKFFYFRMPEVIRLDFRLFYAGTEIPTIRDVLFRSDQVESRRLVVKLIAEDVLFQMLETDHFGERILQRVGRCRRHFERAKPLKIAEIVRAADCGWWTEMLRSILNGPAETEIVLCIRWRCSTSDFRDIANILEDWSIFRLDDKIFVDSGTVDKLWCNYLFYRSKNILFILDIPN